MYFFGATLIGSQFYCVLYRVTLVVDNQQIQRDFVKPFRVVFALLIIFGLSANVGVGMFLTLPHPTLRTDGSIEWIGVMDSLFLLQENLIADTDRAIFCVQVDAASLKISLAIIALFTVIEVASMLCGLWVIRKVKKHTIYSAKTKEMHLQLTRLLVAQVSSYMVGPIRVHHHSSDAVSLRFHGDPRICLWHHSYA